MLPSAHTQAKLFDKKFIALTLRDARHCSKCKREYDISYKQSAADNKPRSSRPVLLNCGHNICENCIYKHRHNLTCPACSIPIEFEQTRWLKKCYDLNFYLVGQLMNSKAFFCSDNGQFTGNVQYSSALSESFVQICGECEKANAVGICMNCKVDFCRRCFTSVHQNSKVLKKHQLTEFDVAAVELKLPKVKICEIHMRMCDRYCVDCQVMCCAKCTRDQHGKHTCTTLANENAIHKDKIVSFLETMKQTRENIRKAQKDARVCENRLEYFASGVILEVNNFFLEIHNYLQLEERRILDEFKKAACSAQKPIHEAMAKLAHGQTTLNNMRSSLEGYIHKPSKDFHINSAIELATVQLEKIPCQIQISEIQTNPFVFKKLKDLTRDFRESYEVITHDPQLSIRIMPMYGDLECFEISSERSPSPVPTSSRMNTMDYRPSVSISSCSTIAVGKSKRIVRVTNIISPSQFYVQDEGLIADIRLKLSEIDGSSGLIESVSMGEMYLAYHVGDKAWHRCIVKEMLKRTKSPSKTNKDVKYKAFLMDYGIILDDIQQKCLRKVDDHVRSFPPAAVLCRLVDIAPTGKEWTSEARQLMEEIIQNKTVQLIIQDTRKMPWNVEVYTTGSSDKVSLREALLYTGMGVDSSVELPQKNLKFSGTKPTQLSKMKYRLQRPVLHASEFFRVKISHVENPQQFFAIQFAKLEELINLSSEMEIEYSLNQSDMIYYAQAQMCCAINVDEKWYRGCVEEIIGSGNIRVRLVDNGRSVTVNWRHLRTLKERFTSISELSIECGLADVQPLQKNDYEWTDYAIAEFVRMTSNPHIQMTITSSNQFRYKVILNVVKKHLDINIAAMMVQFKHALTTGEASTVVDNVLSTHSPIDPLLVTDRLEKTQQATTAENLALRTLKRTAIQVVKINTPGEFYIHLVEHIPGINKFHEKLQTILPPMLDDLTKDLTKTKDWQIDDHCLVLTSINDNDDDQWYRGVIKHISDYAPDLQYSVFLRDWGVTVREIKKIQVAPIDNVYDRVCNAAVLCHLACVHPTGGMKTWSHSSIDEFQHSVNSFETLGATIQGTIINSSIPVVLWGMITETNDPLAPCTTKYTNINKLLVCAGLAHMLEKIDISRQIDMFIQGELEQGQQTLQDWYENFKETLDCLPNFVDNSEQSNELESSVSGHNLSALLEDAEIATSYIPAEPIQKTVFTAYPTYVDHDAIVYMHDANKHTLLAKMRTKINEEIKVRIHPDPTRETWNVGNLCLARYHLDNSLYRAVIHRILSNNKYNVYYIDYGNVETCDARDLHRIPAFPKIPMQAVRFKIDGIQPKGGAMKFTTSVLDLIHGMIVDKLCAIRVVDSKSDIKSCSIRFENNDLARYLIQNGYAINKVYNSSKSLNKLPLLPVSHELVKDESENSEDELMEFIKNQICDSDAKPTTSEPPSSNNNAMFKPDEYRQMYEKMQCVKLYTSFTEVDSTGSPVPKCASNIDEEDDDDLGEVNFSFRSNYWQADGNVESGAPPIIESDSGSNFDNFDPMDTSSLMSNFSGIEVYKSPQLPTSVNSFLCDVAYVRSPTILHIFPHLSELDYRQVELARRIQLMARKSLPLLSFVVKTPCLAVYSKDKMWYRAVIRSHNATTRLVKVFYVDFLNSEIVAEENIRRCPTDLLTWPLRTFETKLHGIKQNPRMREKDVKKALTKCVRNRTLVGNILKRRGKSYEICLFEVEKDTLVYEELIQKNYYTRDL